MADAARLRALIADVRRRWFTAVVMRTTGAALAVAAAPLLAAAAAHALLAPAGTPLLLLAGSAVALTLVGLGLMARRLDAPPGETRVARFIEERAEASGAPPLDDAVVSAVAAASVSRGETQDPLASLVVRGALQRLEGLDAAAVVPAVVLRRSALVAAAGTAMMVAGVVAAAPLLAHGYDAARLRWTPQSIEVHVEPGDVRLVAGRPLTVRARVESGGEAIGRAQPTLVVTAGGDTRTVPMDASGDGYRFDFASVDRSFGYRVVAGAAVSNDYAVTALFAPRIARIELEYRYPGFTGLEPRTDEDGGDIFGPAGTKVRLRIHTDKPVTAGELMMAGTGPDVRAAGPQVLEADLVIARDDSYRVRLHDADGLSSAGDSEYFIRVMEDRPPDVRILRPSGDQSITPLQEVPIEARAEDDYGIGAFELVYAVAGGAETIVPFADVAGDATEKRGAHLLAAEDLRVQPGDVITYYARARDVARGRRSTLATSEMFFLEVKPFGEEFVAAQSQAGGSGGGDPQLDALIQAQKDIISATWNIERRSGGGRSADDVAAIAKAQAELKARVERLRDSRGRRGRGFIAQRQAPRRWQVPPPAQAEAGDGDPVARAVEAMALALEQLGAGRMKDAIPHEMTALNGLLQAQAEIRRRQITQQARGGGRGSGNRQSQDLSALFDKELQRQQRTNYEQRSQVDERPEAAQTDQGLADRIRELARRQEEINRQQQALAKASAEERKRQLDKLAREQEELQRETQAVGGQADDRASAAASQMGQAAGDMRRDDRDSAAQRGQRAADALRRLEQQMRGGQADAGQRAADLQAEAQQIAQEQRRIAAEAERMEQGGDAGQADARRRLAADKDRLSERVDALQREADRLGGEQAAGGEAATRAREASARLERENVGDRMRDTAQRLRDGARPSGTGEQQLARTLDDVVRALGGAASDDARALAEQLDRSRQTRERLDALEAQMRQAEAGGDAPSKERLEALREEYGRELARARDGLGRQPQAGMSPESGRGSTPEQHEFSRSAPGTEAFKQDRGNWSDLRRSLDHALEAHDEAVSRKLARMIGEDRLNAGGSDRVPDGYRELVARYYESLARVKR